MSATVAANAPSDAQDISCAICCERKKSKRLHSVCTTCIGDDKKCCLKCHSKLLHLCDPLSSCINVHYECPFCRTEVQRDVLRKSALFGSNPWCRKTSELWEKHCKDVMRDRINLEDMLQDAVNALTHSPLDKVTARRRNAILRNARNAYHRTERFLEAYTGYMEFRRAQPMFESEQQARETFVRLAGEFQQSRRHASVDGDES